MSESEGPTLQDIGVALAIIFVVIIIAWQMSC